MIKKMLVNASNPEERRVAIVEDGVLSELDIEIVGREQTKGNIYKAAVVRVETGLQAAFVDYGAERLGFLQLGEIHPSLYPQRGEEENKPRPRINDILHRGQEILVQITKEERGNKGAALTTFLSLPGRYMVLMPDDNARGISRKIPDGSDRKALRAAISDLELPENMGYIIRTAAIGKSGEELKRDLDYLLCLYANISSHAKSVNAPAPIYQESNLVIRSIRDYFTLEMDEVLIDDPKVFNEAREFFTQVMPHHLNIVKLHQEQRPIFSKYQIEEQIDTISQNQVNLPSGGSIVIDPTEALVAIDVNSGKMASEQGIEATAFKTNLEAADEVARQLRLRDLGGLVVIDFIDMRDRKHGREVEKRLKNALSGDKARVTVGRISQFGLMEMSRQRIKATLAAAAWYSCPHCQGRGKVKSTEAQAVAIMRKIHAGVAKKQIGKVEAAIPSAVAEYLLNTRREELLDMERRYNTSIYLKGEPDLVAEEVNLDFIKREKPPAQVAETAAPVTAAAALAETISAEADEDRRRHDSVPKQDAEGKQPTAEVGVPEAETTEASSEEAPRRPRRRRRRGRRGGARTESQETGQDQAQTEQQPASAPTENEPLEKTAESTEAAETASPELTDTEQPAKAKPRRSRSRRRKPSAAAANGETPQQAETESQATDAAPSKEEPAAVDTTGEPEKPRRRRSSPRKKAEQSIQATEDKGAAETASNQPEQTVEATPETDAVSEAAPKPKRRRAPRKKTVEPAPVDVPVDAPVAEVTTSEVPEIVATESAPDKKARPSRRRTPAKKTEELPPDQSPTNTSAPEAKAVKSEVKEEEKPKRRRTTRKKIEDSPVVEETVKTSPVVAAEVEKPKRRAPRKKVTTEAPAAAPEATPGEETPKPKRKPAPRKRATKATPETTEAGTPDSAPESKPRRRAPRKKTTPKED